MEKEKSDVQKQPAQAPKPSDELLKNGTVTLTAKTREELQEKTLALIASASGNAYAAGAAGYDASIDAYIIIIKTKEDKK